MKAAKKNILLARILWLYGEISECFSWNLSLLQFCIFLLLSCLDYSYFLHFLRSFYEAEYQKKLISLEVLAVIQQVKTSTPVCNNFSKYYHSGLWNILSILVVWIVNFGFNRLRSNLLNPHFYLSNPYLLKLFFSSSFISNTNMTFPTCWLSGMPSGIT